MAKELMYDLGDQKPNRCHIGKGVWDLLNAVQGPHITGLGDLSYSSSFGGTAHVDGFNFGTSQGATLLVNNSPLQPNNIVSWGDTSIQFNLPAGFPVGDVVPVQVIAAHNQFASNITSFTGTE